MATVTFNLMDSMREDYYDETSTMDFEYSATPTDDTLTMMLFSALTLDQNTDVTLSDLAARTEVTGTNYTAGGNELGNAAVTMDGSGLVTIDSDDPATWSQNGSGFGDATDALIVMKNAGDDETWDILGFSDEFTAAGNVAGDFTIQIASGGIFTSAR